MILQEIPPLLRMAVKSYEVLTRHMSDIYTLSVRGLVFNPDLDIVVPPVLQQWVQRLNFTCSQGIYEIELDFVFTHYFLVSELPEIVVTEAADRMLR